MLLTLYEKDWNTVKKIISFDIALFPGQTKESIISLISQITRQGMTFAEFIKVANNIAIPPLDANLNELVLVRSSVIADIDEILLVFEYKKSSVRNY